ncbi:YlbG family protein [Paenibacillus ginsengarvi]|uniref:DUF2129 domain-containing protein n=1 Tax=Paenibacillus ginsengarvi TaxID=400777 RepID=A0A3B0CT31_9BACL|nr:YlbG family protein [Paenibacillus ginsengarvi]RKN86654.1 DUF2129 domain-containing protein [Paenibacillus ginsengarvi]
MYPQRTGLILWVSDSRHTKQLEKFGTIHYVSKRMHYVVLYVNSDRAEEATKAIQKLSFVKKIERSYRNEIRTEYNSNVPDKANLYT